MAYSDPRFGYHQPPHPDSASLDSKRGAFIVDDDDSAVLDPSILDADIMQSPNNQSYRKDSFANSNGVLSPADSQAWDHHPYNGALPVEAVSAGASNTFQEDGNGFMRQSNPQPQPYVHQHHQPSWSYENASADCNPTTGGGEFMPPPAQFEPNHFHRNDSVHGAFNAPPPPPPFNAPHNEGNFLPAPQVQTPMSPHSHQDWMGMAQQEMEGRPSHKRMRPDSPPRTVIDYQRRDGIRKKNGRIDIPQERNIQTIDDLIEKTTDDELLKELKQQKRLLRNREAALASRQRKKKHTEDLEIKEKSYTQQISHLESRINELSIEREHRERDRQIVIHRLEEANRIIESMQDEKSDLIMRHNDEASSLRKKVQILSEQLEAGPAPAMSAVPSSTGFTDFNAEMEALNMGPHDWDSFILASDLHNDATDDAFNFDHRPQPVKSSPVLEKKSSAATITAATKKASHDTASDQPIASGLLFMLLLCGAFVASKPASSQPADLPNMPADVRAAAPTVLNNLLSETNLVNGAGAAHSSVRVGQEPMPSSVPFSSNSKSTRMDRMHRAITSPTKQQEIDQAFALTPAQYASMTNPDFPIYDQAGQGESTPGPRRTLAEALATLENQHTRHSKAEVYTRSLLWDQIPADVVQQFRQIVKDNNEIEARQQQQQQQRRPSHDFTYKLEQ